MNINGDMDRSIVSKPNDTNNDDILQDMIGLIDDENGEEIMHWMDDPITDGKVGNIMQAMSDLIDDENGEEIMHWTDDPVTDGKLGDMIDYEQENEEILDLNYGDMDDDAQDWIDEYNADNMHALLPDMDTLLNLVVAGKLSDLHSSS